ncbi:TPA: amidohydrolase [Vibrio vulnificus]|nr:amidohydrolase [Vibrio vulnificus]PWY35468.1 amidohydrolase [Vibrio vulnificus]RZP66869.1 amidohydrolase [Vibrio vulnificus]RZR11807.1 amidohydrolase [Vibrio vulnificus]HAS6170783.1 amidohydrolase family protein [Vibrio vulnificus]HAS6278731.1 amidohydrolase family protein [Vibrio vulnificus]
MKNKTFHKAGLEYSTETVLYTGNFITVNKEQPRATATIVKDGKILFVGTKEQAETYLSNEKMEYRLDTQFEGKTIVPGFIEAHMHPLIAAIFTGMFEYGGQYDRLGVGGKLLKGCSTEESLKARLLALKKEHDLAGKTGEWLNLWGLDPLLMTDNTAVDRDFIDAVIDDSPVFFMHASCHLACMNTKALEMVGYSLSDDPEFVRRENGRLTGDIAEMKDIYRALSVGAFNFGSDPAEIGKALIGYANIAHSLGVTTVSDCGMGLPSNPYPLYQALSKNPAFKLRITAYPLIGPFELESVEAMKQHDNDRLSIGSVKYVNTDGSIQGFTANLLDGHTYYNGKPSTSLTRDVEEIYQASLPFHKAGYNISYHCNGNGTTEKLLDIIERMQSDTSMPEARHCLEHNQMVTDAQMDRMKSLGVCHNLFGTHIPVWGDVHATQTVGPELVKRLNPFQTSAQKGIPFSLHCDDGITQVNPLFMIWGAMNRECIFSGNVYGEEECLNAEQALYAVTLGAAYLMNREHMIGSIEVGKLADMAILDENILEVDKKRVRDVHVHATMLGGEISVHSPAQVRSSEQEFTHA